MSPPALPSTDLTGSNSAAQAQADARRIYVTGSRPDLRVPMREISLQPTRGFDDRLTSNAAVRVYDT
jgi:phosphomethylpyrimidine synthase